MFSLRKDKCMNKSERKTIGEHVPETDLSKFKGQYVATVSIFDDKIIAHGNNHDDVYKKATEITNEPMVFFVPREMVSAFTCK
jgi:hypothetical protein